MADDGPLNFEEFRRRRQVDRGLVPCARCGAMILGTVVRCPECGVHFDGAAEDFTRPPEGSGRSTFPAWVVALAVLLLAAMLLSVFAG